MNTAQKAELRANIAGTYGVLADIFNPREIPSNVAKHAATTLKQLLTGNETALKQFEAEFSTHQILESILQIRRIINHPHPQNRRVGGMTTVYTTYTADNRDAGVRLLENGIDETYGFVYWNEPDGQRKQCREEIGLLGLTARQNKNEKPITKADLLEEIKIVINESYIEYLESANEALESKDSQKDAALRYPQMDFSPTQITCLITRKIFHTPVILITQDNQCSGIIEKEKALFILDAHTPNSQPLLCPITRKPLVGFIVCKATQAMANQFWEKYQSGTYTEEFFRYEPRPETATRPNCILLNTEDNSDDNFYASLEEPSVNLALNEIFRPSSPFIYTLGFHLRNQPHFFSNNPNSPRAQRPSSEVGNIAIEDIILPRDSTFRFFSLDALSFSSSSALLSEERTPENYHHISSVLFLALLIGQTVARYVILNQRATRDQANTNISEEAEMDEPTDNEEENNSSPKL